MVQFHLGAEKEIGGKTMPKMKSSKTLSKRIRFSASGKVKVHHSGMGHLAPRKTRKQRKHLSGGYYLNSIDQKRVEDMLASKK